MDIVTLFLMMKALKKEPSSSSTSEKTSLAGLLEKIKKPKATTTPDILDTESGEDEVEGGKGSDTLLPAIGGLHSTGLPLNLPAGTILRSPSGQQITLAQLTSTDSALPQVPAGGMVILPNGQYYTKPGGAVMPTLQGSGNVNLPYLPAQPTGNTGSAGNVGTSQPTTFLGGLGQGLGQSAPAILQAGGELIGDFFSWLTTPSNGGSSSEEVDYGELFGVGSGNSGEVDYGDIFGL